MEGRGRGREAVAAAAEETKKKCSDGSVCMRPTAPLPLAPSFSYIDASPASTVAARAEPPPLGHSRLLAHRTRPKVVKVQATEGDTKALGERVHAGGQGLLAQGRRPREWCCWREGHGSA